MDRGIAELWTLAVTDDSVQHAMPLLDAAEQERASRFQVEPPKAAFVATRGALRQLCAKYLHLADGRDVTFAWNEHGKPYLPGSDLQFNVSHSGKVAILGFTWEQRLGVDVERTGRRGDIRGIASRFFHPDETARIQADADPLQAFYRCWTAKEAYVKAVGTGLTLGLDSFCINLSSAQPAIVGQPEWSLQGWNPAPGYIASAAVEGAVRFLHRDEPIF